MIKIITLVAVFCCLNVIYSQEKFKIMAYNILNFGNSSDEDVRIPYLKKIMDDVQPDILVLEEVVNQSALNTFKNGALTSLYACGTFVDGYDSDRALCYKINKFQFISNTPIDTDLRDINMFTVKHLGTGETLRVFGVHLKASDGDVEAADRAQEIQQLRAVTNTFSINDHFIVAGDFNMYRSTEAAYQLLKAPNGSVNGYVIDPITMNGEWGVSSYKQHHTQSPRFESFGGGVSGGLDDRFDMVLYSKSISDPGGLDYIANSTVPYGNDGLHYNKSINDLPTNTAVGQELADALYYGSDHLPIIAEFIYNEPVSLEENHKNSFNIYPNPTNSNLTISSSDLIEELVVTNLSGKVFYHDLPLNTNQELDLSNYSSGIYFVSISNKNGKFVQKIIKQ